MTAGERASDKAARLEAMAAFRRYDAECRANTEDSPAIEALNRLPVDERAMAILHIVNRGKVSVTAAMLGCDRTTMRKYLRAIRETIRENLERLECIREAEEWLNWL